MADADGADLDHDLAPARRIERDLLDDDRLAELSSDGCFSGVGHAEWQWLASTLVLNRNRRALFLRHRRVSGVVVAESVFLNNSEKETAMSRFASVFILTASMAGVTACALDPGTEPSTGSTDQATTTEDTSSATGEDAAIRIDPATNAAGEAVPAAQFPCRKVTASSIPVFTTAGGSTVRCTFFAGDIFQFQAVASNGRLETWCPRHTSIANGLISWAQLAGTVGVTCPF